MAAKRKAKYEVYSAKKSASEERFQNLNDNDKLNRVFQLTRKMRSENQDIIGEKCIRNKDGNIVYDDPSKFETWRQHYEGLLNSEFVWDESSLSAVEPVLGPSIQITEEMVSLAFRKMKSGKSAGPSGIVSEMLKASDDSVVPVLTRLINTIIREGRVPDEWNKSYIISLYKGKGDSLDCGNYRGLKLLEVLQKVLEQILETQIRKEISID